MCFCLRLRFVVCHFEAQVAVNIDMDTVAAISDIVGTTKEFCCCCEIPLPKSLYLVWYLVILVAIGLFWSLEYCFDFRRLYMEW